MRNVEISCKGALDRTRTSTRGVAKQPQKTLPQETFTFSRGWAEIAMFELNVTIDLVQSNHSGFVGRQRKRQAARIPKALKIQIFGRSQHVLRNADCDQKTESYRNEQYDQAPSFWEVMSPRHGANAQSNQRDSSEYVFRGFYDCLHEYLNDPLRSRGDIFSFSSRGEEAVQRAPRSRQRYALTHCRNYVSARFRKKPVISIRCGLWSSNSLSINK
jgi:hypothetical protein